MITLKSLTIVAAVLAGGTSLAMAQNGLPTGGEAPVAGGAGGGPAPGYYGYGAPTYFGAPGYAAPAYAIAPAYAAAPGYVAQPVMLKHRDVWRQHTRETCTCWRRAVVTNGWKLASAAAASAVGSPLI
jgi:hypothetical protein